MDVHQGALLGQHALSYTMLSYLAIMIHRRLVWFGLLEQMLQVLPLFAAAHAASLAVRMIAGDRFPGWSLLAAPAHRGRAVAGGHRPAAGTAAPPARSRQEPPPVNRLDPGSPP